jgi:hypothetical protein
VDLFRVVGVCYCFVSFLSVGSRSFRRLAIKAKFPYPSLPRAATSIYPPL